jgi:hypothetical protein
MGIQFREGSQFRYLRKGRRIMSIRQMVFDALQLQNGLSSRDIIDYIHEIDSTILDQNVYTTLHDAKKRGALQHEGRKYYLPTTETMQNVKLNGVKSIRPVPAAPSPSANGNGLTTIAPFKQKRPGIRLGIYSSPRYFEEVVALSILIGEQWFPVPMFDNMRMCIGYEIPEWSPYQLEYRNVVNMRITFKNGQVQDERPALKDVITIAPE